MVTIVHASSRTAALVSAARHRALGRRVSAPFHTADGWSVLVKGRAPKD